MPLFSLKESEDAAGRLVVLPSERGEAAVVRAFFPRPSSQRPTTFLDEPAIGWRGSIGADAAADVARRALELLGPSECECECEIWAHGAPKPRIFVLKNIEALEGYLSEWSKRAGVSLTVKRNSDKAPLLYISGTLKDAARPRDEVAMKLRKDIIVNGPGIYLLSLLFGRTRPSVMGGVQMSEFVYSMVDSGVL